MLQAGAGGAYGAPGGPGDPSGWTGMAADGSGAGSDFHGGSGGGGEGSVPPAKRRGRPPGSKNKPKMPGAQQVGWMDLISLAFYDLEMVLLCSLVLATHHVVRYGW